MNLETKNVIITGASDGIGRSMAIALAKEGACLFLFGRDANKLEQVSQLCIGAKSVRTYSFDINDNQKRKEIVDTITKEYEIDVLINNAGVWQKVGPLDSVDSEIIENIISTNLTSQILLTHQLYPLMKDRETAIINVISRSGIEAQKGQSIYAASKFGMKGFTEVLCADTKDLPIRIAGVYQSGTNTEFFRKAGEDFNTESFTNPNDLAHVVVFMLSQPKNLWIRDIRIER